MNFLKLFTIVPEKHVYIVERLGKFNRQLSPGFNWLIPVVESVSYQHSTKEIAIQMEDQTAITQDNVSLNIDGVLFVKIFDPMKASYQVETPLESVKLLALTLMRSEIGKMRLDKLFQERDELNKAINAGVNSATEVWGINCLRYEILNIDPPEEIKRSMQAEAEAERLKRRDILLSEAKMMSEINVATGKNKAVILSAEGEAESINVITQMEKEAISMITKALSRGNASKIINYILLQNYLKDYANILKKGRVTVAPQDLGQGGNDIATVAAMLLAQQRGGHSYRDVEEPRSSRPMSFGNEGNDKVRDEDYSNIVKKLNFYTDPELYSSDEENQRKSSSLSKAQQNAQHLH